MIKKVFAISMVVLMLAGIFISVANFTSSDLEAADIRTNGRWQWVVIPYVGWLSWECAFESFNQNCIVGQSQLLIIP